MKPFVGKSKGVDGYGNQNLSPSGSSGWPVNGSGIDAHLFFLSLPPFTGSSHQKSSPILPFSSCSFA